MNTLFYVVCIVAIVFTADTIQKYMKMKNDEKRAQDPELEETLAQIERLEERIQVLERIITENKYDLSREISNLK
ncbi:MAG: phage shock protein B [Gammaproteobacteria bacterium]|nr:phage shock protein B [Gammaproteobacteria bacterium]MDH3362813.1 phage shock protein B [Gammaproteobacteria bacterium]MDH3480512.1 phage shock protein B [Gammaproteobacteria bacterium]